MSEVFGAEGAPCFSTFMAETRASTSTTAQLKNFVLGSFDTCGDVTIVKNTVPNGPQDFNFNATTLGTGADFLLDDDGNATLSNTQVFEDVNPGSYTVSEDQVAGWVLTDISCVESVTGNSVINEGAASVTINVDPTESVTCTFENTERGSITIRKLTSPADAASPDDFDFTFANVPPASDPGTVALGHGDIFTIDGLMPGAYSATEADPPGAYSLGEISCDDADSEGDNATRTANFDLDPGEDIICTFVNVLPGTITITKVADPSDGTDFGFTTTGGNGLADFSLDDDNDTNATLPDTQTFTVPAGAYTVDETTLAGWDLDEIECVASAGSTASGNAGTGVASINLADGGSAACTYVNVKRGQIIVDKVTTPSGDDTSFDFDASYDADGFSLTDAAAPNESVLLPPGEYSVSETVPAGWDLTSATCDDDSDPAAIDLDPGETVTCTFENLKLGKIITVKQTDPDGATATFSFDPSWGAGFNLQDGQSNDSGFLDPGNYDIGEFPTLGWELISTDCVSDLTGPEGTAVVIDLDPGETITCTFLNRQLGRIIVEKQTLPDTDPTLFDFDASWDVDGIDGPDSFQLADDDTENTGLIASGPYSVSETVPAGWDLTSATCTDGSDPDAIDLDPGETVTCTFNNTKLGTIIVEKQTSPDGAAGDFTFTGDAAGTLSDDEQIVVTDLDPGTYTSTEGDPGADWNLGDISCDDGDTLGAVANSSGDVGTATATFELDPGETVTCTFLNVMDGSITIVKDADPADGTDFGFTTTGAGLSDFSLDDDGDATLPSAESFLSLSPGAYSVTESALAGWDLDGHRVQRHRDRNDGHADRHERRHGPCRWRVHHLHVLQQAAVHRDRQGCRGRRVPRRTRHLHLRRHQRRPDGPRGHRDRRRQRDAGRYVRRLRDARRDDHL